MVGPVRPLIDPRAQEADLFRRQPLAFLRHDLFFALEAGNELYHEALSAVPGHDDRAVLAAFERNFPGVPP